MSGRCPAVNPDTGIGCRLEPDHELPHLPIEAPAPTASRAKAEARKNAARGADQARLAAVDRSVRDGRRGRRADQAPDGTYGTRPEPVYRCAYGCPGPARRYMNASLCAHHAPGAPEEHP